MEYIRRTLYNTGVSRLTPARMGALLASVIVLLFVFSSAMAQSFDVSRARGSVVRVIADGGNSIGSGSIVKVQGTKAYVLTAYHVIQKDAENGVPFVEVELFTEEKLRARISQRQIDALNDIAILTVDQLPTNVPREIPWGYSAELRDLEKVYAVGHPGIEVGWHVTDGRISRIQGGKVYFSGPAVSPKNSGGPLLNERGELVGMNLRLDDQGVAIREDIARAIIDRWVPSLPPRVTKLGPKPPAASISPYDPYESFMSAVDSSEARNPLKDPRVREAIRIVLRGQDVPGAKKRMYEAGYPDGISLNLVMSKFKNFGGSDGEADVLIAKLRAIGIRVKKIP